MNELIKNLGVMLLIIGAAYFGCTVFYWWYDK